jgi:hypothetical protein
VVLNLSGIVTHELANKAVIPSFLNNKYENKQTHEITRSYSHNFAYIDPLANKNTTFN